VLLQIVYIIRLIIQHLDILLDIKNILIDILIGQNQNKQRRGMIQIKTQQTLLRIAYIISNIIQHFNILMDILVHILFDILIHIQL